MKENNEDQQIRRTPGGAWLGLYFIILLAGTAPLAAQSAHKPLRSGDREYDKERYSEAEKEYRKAVKEEAANPNTSYNLGNALYMQGKYEDASPVYEQSLQNIKDPLALADALHNIGNAYFKQGKYDKAVEAYENSLRRRPGDPETKRNLQMAKKKRKQENEKQKQEQQKKKQQEEEQNQQNQQDQNQQQQQNQQDKQQQNQQQQNEQQNQQQKPQQPQDQPEEQAQPGEMTRKEAQRLLETAVGREDQKNARKYREQQPSKPKGSKKDW